MKIEYRTIVNDITAFLQDCRDCTPGSRYVVVCPTTEYADVVIWPVISGFARNIEGWSIDDGARSLVLPNLAEVHCLGAENLLLLRGVKVTGALFLDSANHVQMVEKLKLERRFANEPPPSPQFGL